MAVQEYLDRITSEHRDKPKFIAWLTSILTPTDDIYNCINKIDDAFDLDKAVGNQLDVLGELIGVSRTLVFQPLDMSPLLDDDTYRLVLKAKIGKNMWQGTKTEVQEIWDGMFSDLQLDLIDKEELNHYIHAKKYVQTLTEDEVKNLCFEVKDLYEDVLKEFEIKL